MDGDLLLRALSALKHNPRREGDTITFDTGSYNVKTGQLTLRTYAGQSAEEMTSTIKKAYSAEIVKSQAARYGWTLKQTAPFQYEIAKR